MHKIFGVKKQKDPPPSIDDASSRISKRGEDVGEKIKKLDAGLARYKDQIKKTRPGPAQEAVKARAMRVLKQKRMYEGQRDMLYNQTFNLDQVSFAAESIKDAQQTMSSLKLANEDLKGMMKTVKINEIDNLQDEMSDLMDVSNEIQETLGRSYNVPGDIDEDGLMGELDGLELDMESESQGVPSYLQPGQESDLESELNLPSAPVGPATGRDNSQVEGKKKGHWEFRTAGAEVVLSDGTFAHTLGFDMPLFIPPQDTGRTVGMISSLSLFEHDPSLQAFV